MKTILVAKENVRFYWEQYKIFKNYNAGTKFTLVRYADGLQPTSAKVIAPGGLIGTMCIKIFNRSLVNIINE